MVSTPLKNISQNGNLPQISGWTFKKYLSCHQTVFWFTNNKINQNIVLYSKERFSMFFQFSAEKNRWAEGFSNPTEIPAASIFFLVLCRGRDRIATDRAFSLPETNSKNTWKWMVGIWSFLFGKPGLFSGAFAVSFRECILLLLDIGVLSGSFQWSCWKFLGLRKTMGTKHWNHMNI